MELSKAKRWGLPVLVILILVGSVAALYGNRVTKLEDIKNISVAIAGAFFVYEVLAGALFATTSVSLDAKRVAGNPGRVEVKVTVERGDRWLVVIEHDLYAVGDVPQLDKDWQQIGLPRRAKGVLRLGPKEKTQSTFLVETNDCTKDAVITVKVIGHSVMWPVSACSYAKVIVPSTPEPKL